MTCLELLFLTSSKEGLKCTVQLIYQAAEEDARATVCFSVTAKILT